MTTTMPSSPRRRTRPHRSSGFTLLEVLIAIVVFSIGLLGIATLQIAGMKQAFNANVRTVAMQQASDIADRMRANKQGFRDGEYDIAAMPADWDVDCAADPCEPDELAEYDLVEWNDANADVLPLGVGMVCVDATPDDGDDTDWQCDGNGDVYAVKVQWTERAETDDAQADTRVERFVMRVLPW